MNEPAFIWSPVIKAVKVGPVVVAWIDRTLILAFETEPREWQLTLGREGATIVEVN